MLGKKVGAFPDVRFQEGKWWGANYDNGGLDHKSQQMFLAISGGDNVTIGRIYDVAAGGVLPIKLMVASNRVLNLNDAPLQGRFLKLLFTKTFREGIDLNPNLKEDLRPELPGIAARCVAAYQRMLKRGHFIQPDSGKVLEQELAKARDAFAVMVQDCIEPVPDMSEAIPKTAMYACWRSWSDENDVAWRTVKEEEVGKKLKAVPGFSHVIWGRPMLPNGGRQGPRCWMGTRFNEVGKGHYEEGRRILGLD
jgi:phage/plasmid-associated DNA primase